MISALDFIFFDKNMRDFEVRRKGVESIALLSSLRDLGLIQKIQADIIYSQEGVAESLIFFNTFKYTKNNYPFLYFCLQPRDTKASEEIKKIMEENNFILVEEEDKEFSKTLK